MMKENLNINGELITGGVATGKTTLLAYQTALWLKNVPSCKLVAVGRGGFFRLLDPALRQETRHEFTAIENYPVGSEIQGALLHRINELINSRESVLVAIDESAHFFSDRLIREKFALLMFHAKPQSETSFRLLMTFQSLRVCEDLFGGEFAQNFSDYLILRGRREPFFNDWGIDASCIERRRAFRLRRSEAMGVLGLESSAPFSFVPGKPDSGLSEIPKTFYQRWSAFVGA